MLQIGVLIMLVHDAHSVIFSYFCLHIQITGDASEAQILAATAAYLDRPEVLVKALNELFHIFRFDTCHHQPRALDLILLAMLRHRNEKHIQISGRLVLYFTVI